MLSLLIFYLVLLFFSLSLSLSLSLSPYRLLLASLCSDLTARSLSMLVGSLSHICILMKGSRPLMLSMCHGFGLDSSSDTEPWDRPSTASPNSWKQVIRSVTCRVGWVNFSEFKITVCGGWKMSRKN